MGCCPHNNRETINVTDGHSIYNFQGGEIKSTASSGIAVSNSGDFSVTNEVGGRISGGERGIDSEYLYTYVTLDNAGEIAGSAGVGTILNDAATVLNKASGHIYGAGGVLLGRSTSGRLYTLTNDGSIQGLSHTLNADFNHKAYGSGAGVFLAVTTWLTLTNSIDAMITGGVHGIYQMLRVSSVPHHNTIKNAGLISGSDTGIFMEHGNLDVVNSGVIEGQGGVAISFSQDPAYTENSLHLQTGSTITGNVIGALHGKNALHLEGTGIEDLTKFSNFATLEVHNAPATNWTVHGVGRFSDNVTIKDRLHL